MVAQALGAGWLKPSNQISVGYYPIPENPEKMTDKEWKEYYDNLAKVAQLQSEYKKEADRGNYNGLFIQGTLEYKKKVLALLETLTDDELIMVEVTADISKVLIWKETKGDNKPAGTELLRSVIGSGYSNTIYYVKDQTLMRRPPEEAFLQGGGKSGSGTSTTIDFDPDFDLKILQGTHLEYSSLRIMLGHELIHAQRANAGRMIDLALEEKYKADDRTRQARIEELATTGIVSYPFSPYYQKITENTLRAEHGMALRTRY